MLVAAIIMICISIPAFIFSWTSFFTSLLCGLLWIASGVSAIVAIRKVRQDLLLVTVVILSITLLLNVIQIILVLVVTISNGILFVITIVVLVLAAIFTFLNIWFLVITVKCRKYLAAKQSFLCSNPGFYPRASLYGPVEFESVPQVVHYTPEGFMGAPVGFGPQILPHSYPENVYPPFPVAPQYFEEKAPPYQP